jgi:SAM-dependent methyltransferase
MYRLKGRALRRAVTGMRAGSQALDIGSGVGWVVGQLLRRGFEVEGCDISPAAVERLRGAIPEATFFEIQLGRDPIPRESNSFDLVTALDVLYHVTEESPFEDAVREIARVTRPGGKVIVTDGFGDSDRSPAPHVRFRSLTRWKRAGEEQGIELRALLPLYRWMSRSRRGVAGVVPDRLRGPAEYVLETVWRRPPHMQMGVFERASS